MRPITFNFLEKPEEVGLDESILSYGSGSIRSGARSPRKRVKLWHPSQDNVSPFLNESTERNLRRKCKLSFIVGVYFHIFDLVLV